MPNGRSDGAVGDSSHCSRGCEDMKHSTTANRVVRSMFVLFALTGCAEKGNAQAGDATPGVDTRTPVAPAALPDFRPLVRRYGDAVVNVEVQQNARQARGQSGGEPPLPE